MLSLLDSFSYDSVILVKRFLCECNACPAFNQRIPISLMCWTGKIFVFLQFTVPFSLASIAYKWCFEQLAARSGILDSCWNDLDVFSHLLRYGGWVFPNPPCYGLECYPMEKTVLYFCPFLQSEMLGSCS